MIKPKIRLVRIEDIPFSEHRLISELTAKANMRLGNKGRILDDHIGFGFTVNMGEPKTIKDYLYPTSSLTNRTTEQISQVKNLLENGKL